MRGGLFGFGRWALLAVMALTCASPAMASEGASDGATLGMAAAVIQVAIALVVGGITAYHNRLLARTDESSRQVAGAHKAEIDALRGQVVALSERLAATRESYASKVELAEMRRDLNQLRVDVTSQSADISKILGLLQASAHGR